MAKDVEDLKRLAHEVGRTVQTKPFRLRAVLVADADGNVEHPNRKGFCFARLHGDDASSRCLVLNRMAPAVAGVQVWVEMERRAYSYQYKVVGIWDGISDSEDQPAVTGLPLHAFTHERWSGRYDVDPVNVYPRMYVQGRVDQTAPASLGVVIRYIRYYWDGIPQEFSTTTTNDLDVPTSQMRYALVYFVPAENDYGVRYGTIGFPPLDHPGVEAGELPLAEVLLYSGMTDIVDNLIFDRRDLLSILALTAGGGGGGGDDPQPVTPVPGHNLLTMSLPVCYC